MDLKEAFAKLGESNSNLSALYPCFENYNETVKELVLELINSLNKDALTLANQQSSLFLNAIQNEADKPGSSWESIYIYFEWTAEIQKIMEGSDFSDQVKSIV